MPPTRASESLSGSTTASSRPRRSLPSMASALPVAMSMAPPTSLPPSRSRPRASAPLQPPDHAKPPPDRRASLRRDPNSTASPAPAPFASSSSSKSSSMTNTNGAQVPPRASWSSLSTAKGGSDPKTPDRNRKTRSQSATQPKGKGSGASLLGARSPEVKAAVAKARKRQIHAVKAALAKSAEEDAEVEAELAADIFGGGASNGDAAAVSRGEAKAGRKRNEGGKEYMIAGFYCQDATASSPHKLVSKILKRREQEAHKSGKARRKSGRGKPGDVLFETAGPQDQTSSFPPLPYDHGYKLFFEEEHEFVLPWNIKYEAETGKLDGKKKPMAYSKIRSNLYPERSKYSSDYVAICQCAPSSGCGENCINRIMNYLCGKDCPSGEACTNKSLAKRKGANVKVAYTGNRGFGLVAMEDIKEGDFVIDYRGEVITLHTFLDRCRSDYSKSKNFYALAYDADEVIDAGNKGNEARFINHGCDPNLEVRKYQTLGDGQEEFEVGMWAIKDIKAGQELYYDYNFDSFAVRTSNESLRTRCHCGAANCVGFLGRKTGEKSARVIAQELEAKARADASKSTKRAKKAMKNAIARASVKKAVEKPVIAPKFQPRITAKDVAKARASTATGSARRKQDADAAKAEQRSAAMLATMADILSPFRPKRTRQSMAAAPPPAPSTPTAATPTSSSRKRSRATATETPLTSLSSRRSASGGGDDEDDDDDGTPNSKKSRSSGWADWLKKKASEFPRTREQWEQFALQRRRGRVWLEGMMAEFGVAPHEGAPAEPYTPSIPLPAPGQPQRRGPPPGTPRPPRQSTEAPKDKAADATTKRRSAAARRAEAGGSSQPPLVNGDRSARSSMGPTSEHGFIAHQLKGAPAAAFPPMPYGANGFTADNAAQYALESLAAHLNGNGDAHAQSTRSRRSMRHVAPAPMANGHVMPLPIPALAPPMANGPETEAGRPRRTRSSLPNGH